jgi:aspartyl-tRNA(Asn)/glutamyl-tRNA(Gln) amidotransferase subunit B
MKDYFPTIGLEIHAELKTSTKMFCDSRNNPDESEPNANICPVCMGHPGTLPVINREAVRSVLRVGTALGSAIADYTEFDRKNYFYPDIPKGYQISQYKYPLVSGGELAGVKITRIHLEEDTASSLHDQGDWSLVDFNRAGVPLMELVTEPVIHSGQEAARFGRELQLLLQYLGVSDANMEKGEMRVEANISISADPSKLGTKVEVKNLNSFRAAERAIAYEIERHKKLLERGEPIIQETRGWDDAKQATFSQRKKEDSHDYRYFPDPDLPKLVLSEIPEFSRDALLASLPELPEGKRIRYAKDYALKAGDIEVFVQNPKLAGYFESVVALAGPERAALASNYIVSDLLGIIKKEPTEDAGFAKLFGTIAPKEFAELVAMAHAGEVSSRGAKDILTDLYGTGGSARSIATAKDLFQKSDPEAIRKLVSETLAAYPEAVAEYKAGKEASLQFLVGQGMKLSKGSANPQLLRTAFLAAL